MGVTVDQSRGHQPTLQVDHLIGRPAVRRAGKAAGGEINEIRFPAHLGIAGAVFTGATSMNIPYAYADLRFNPSFDRQTGFFTRSILCVPIINKDNVVLSGNGRTLGLEDGQRLAMNANETPTRGRQLTILEQLLGNVGRGQLPRTDEDVPGQRRPD